MLYFFNICHLAWNQKFHEIATLEASFFLSWRDFVNWELQLSGDLVRIFKLVGSEGLKMALHTSNWVEPLGGWFLPRYGGIKVVRTIFASQAQVDSKDKTIAFFTLKMVFLEFRPQNVKKNSKIFRGLGGMFRVYLSRTQLHVCMPIEAMLACSAHLTRSLHNSKMTLLT